MLPSRTAYIQSAAVSTILLDIWASKFPVGSAGTFSGTSSQPNFSLYPTRYWSQEYSLGDFSGGPVGKTLSFHCRGASFIPGQGTRILHVLWWGQKKKAIPRMSTPSHSVVPNSFNSMDYKAQGSSVHEIFQPRILEWFTISISKGSSQPKDWTPLAGRFFTCVPPGKTNPRARPNKHSAC